MTRTIRISSSIGALFVFVMASFGQDISQDSLDRASAELRTAIKSGEVAGGTHLVSYQGKIVYSDIAGVRDIKDATPLEADTIMRIYSMSKPITSVAAMTLHEQGKFELDDPVAEYIPTFDKTTVFVEDGNSHQIVPAERQITIRDVFRHTTGYSYGDSGPPELQEYYRREGMRYRPPYAMMPPRMTIANAADALARIPALHQPGKRFTYGYSTDLLGRLIEVWSGMSLNEYLRKSIFEPLEMMDTGFSVPADKRGRFASCHAWKDGELIIADKASNSPYNEGFEFLSGGGGLVSSMQDYANFCQLMVDGGEFRGTRVLKESTVKLMFTDQLNGVADDFRFGLGFAIHEVRLGSDDQQRTATQYSWGGYASTDFRLVPDEKLFQVFMRQRVPSSHELANKLFRIVYRGMR